MHFLFSSAQLELDIGIICSILLTVPVKLEWTGVDIRSKIRLEGAALWKNFATYRLLSLIFPSVSPHSYHAFGFLKELQASFYVRYLPEDKFTKLYIVSWNFVLFRFVIESRIQIGLYTPVFRFLLNQKDKWNKALITVYFHNQRQ